MNTPVLAPDLSDAMTYFEICASAWGDSALVAQYMQGYNAYNQVPASQAKFVAIPINQAFNDPAALANVDLRIYFSTRLSAAINALLLTATDAVFIGSASGATFSATAFYSYNTAGGVVIIPWQTGPQNSTNGITVINRITTVAAVMKSWSGFLICLLP